MTWKPKTFIGKPCGKCGGNVRYAKGMCVGCRMKQARDKVEQRRSIGKRKLDNLGKAMENVDYR